MLALHVMPKRKENEDSLEALQKIVYAKQTSATELSLSGMSLTAIPDAIAQLSQLRNLDVSQNAITNIPDSITYLAGLQSLDFSHNKLSSIPASVTRLSQLKKLEVSDNEISTIPEFIAQLHGLENLKLNGNFIATIPDAIAQLSQLQYLDLCDNEITLIPDSVAQLSQLRALLLSGNGITAVPNGITQLARLQRLGLAGNDLTFIPDCLTRLPKVRQLNLGNTENKGFSFTTYHGSNRIAAVPDTIAQLTRLVNLNLSGNQITTIPDSITQLTTLEYLDLSDNRLSAVPGQLSQLPALTTLLLHGNPGLEIPEAILGPRAQDLFRGIRPKAPQDILAYLSQAAADSRPLNEAKLILVGQGAVGKTSLVKALSTGKFKKGERTTEGIKISDWECPLGKKNRATVHIWDFGGQEMMHATHQFFLTQRSLYLLVLNRRQGSIDREADYWFRLIRAFGGKDAAVIVVLNKQKSEPFDVNREGWLEKYQGNIKAFVATDCEDKRSLTQLKRKIVEELQSMASLKTKFPRRWFAIKDALSQMSAEHISFDDYRKLCQRLGESDAASQSSLAGFLHDLGIALNYGQDQRLRFNYVLKPEWVTQGIYALLHAFVRSKGVFTHSEAERELAKKNYSPEDTHFILGLMERFELSFPLDEKPRRVLIPELLDDQQPKGAARFDPAECLNFGYKYPVLTEGLLPRFIARTHHLGKPETRWKSGVILEDSSTGCRALIRADAAEAEVRVHIDGPQAARRELLGIIRYNFEVIHSDYEFKPEAQVYPPAAPQKALSVDELEALGRSKTTVPVVLADKSVIDQNIAALIDPVTSTPPPLTLFLSYSHKDESSIDELRKDLRVMERNGQIRPWYDRELIAGERWEPALLEKMRGDLIVCQLSRNYFASDACVAELTRAIEWHEDGAATLVAYVLTECGWKEFPHLSELQILPVDGRPLADWTDPNKYWRAVVEGIQKAIKKSRAWLLESGHGH
jgi:internalin A